MLKNHVSGLHLISSLILAFSFAQLFAPVNRQSLAFALLTFLVLLVAGTIANGLIALVAPLSLLSLLLNFPILSGAIYGLSGTLVVALLFAGSVAVAIGLRKRPREFPGRQRLEIQSLVATAVVAPIAWFWSRGTNESALRFLAASGEDNAAWLQGLSSNVSTTGEIFLSSESDWSGGPLLSIFHVVSQSLHNFSLDDKYQLFDNSLALTREYGLVLLISMLSMLLIIQKIGILESRSYVSQLPFIGIIVFIAYSGFSAVMFSGHLSLLIVVALILVASLSDFSINPKGELRLFPTLIALGVVSSTALVWVPIAPMVAIFLFLLIARSSKSHFSISRLRNIDKRYAALYLLGALAIAWVVNAGIGGILRSGARLQYLRELLSYLGQTVVPSMWVLFALIVGAIILFQRERFSKTRFATISVILITSSLIYAAGLLLASRFGVKFTLNYAALKYVLFVSVTFLPIALASIHDFLSKSTKGISSWLISLGIFILFLVDGSLSQYISYPWSLDRSKSTWVHVAAEELTKSPENTIVCMSTSDRNLDYEAYKCGRILYSLQGNAVNMQVDQWSAMNLDMTDYKVLNQIQSDFYSKTTIIQLGIPRNFTGVEPRDEWLKTIDWSSPRIVNGN